MLRRNRSMCVLTTISEIRKKVEPTADLRLFLFELPGAPLTRVTADPMSPFDRLA